MSDYLDVNELKDRLDEFEGMRQRAEDISIEIEELRQEIRNMGEDDEDDESSYLERIGC